VVIVFRSGSDGRIDRVHHYTIEQITAARAQLAQLEAPPARKRPVDNAAMRWMERFERAWDVRDWDAIASSYAPNYRHGDRRAGMRGELDRAQRLEGLRRLFETRPSLSISETLATRGDRLALMRIRFEGSGAAIGPGEAESLAVVEVDAAGLRSGAARFAADDLDAASDELDARYAAGEAAAFPDVAQAMRAFRDAFARRDWDALSAIMASDVVVDDHRLIGWETVRGARDYVSTLHSLVDLAPDARLNLDHAEMSRRGLLWIGAWVGTRDGGAFEIPWITVSEHDARGVVLRFDQYDLDHLAVARARLAELGADA